MRLSLQPDVLTKHPAQNWAIALRPPFWQLPMTHSLQKAQLERPTIRQTRSQAFLEAKGVPVISKAELKKEELIGKGIYEFCLSVELSLLESSERSLHNFCLRIFSDSFLESWSVVLQGRSEIGERVFFNLGVQIGFITLSFFEISFSLDLTLGDLGQYGQVYRGMCRGEQVAVKELDRAKSQLDDKVIRYILNFHPILHSPMFRFELG